MQKKCKGKSTMQTKTNEHAKKMQGQKHNAKKKLQKLIVYKYLYKKLSKFSLWYLHMNVFFGKLIGL